jgi:hypothetical protein
MLVQAGVRVVFEASARSLVPLQQAGQRNIHVGHANDIALSQLLRRDRRHATDVDVRFELAELTVTQGRGSLLSRLKLLLKLISLNCVPALFDCDDWKHEGSLFCLVRG